MCLWLDSIQRKSRKTNKKERIEKQNIKGKAKRNIGTNSEATRGREPPFTGRERTLAAVPGFEWW